MSEKKAKPAWVKKIDADWALAYLDGWSRRHPGQPTAAELYDKLCNIGTLKEDRTIDPDLPRKMKAAWASRKFRNKKDQLKLCSFALSMDAARQLDKLSKGGTKTGTLEKIIMDRAAQEIAYKSAKKEEGVYKQHARVFEHQLDLAMEELYTYKLLLTEAGIDLSRKAQHQSEAERLIRKRKSDILFSLAALRSEAAPKKRSRAEISVFTSKNESPSYLRSQVAGAVVPQQRPDKDAHSSHWGKVSSEATQGSSAVDTDNNTDGERSELPSAQGTLSSSQRRSDVPRNASIEDNRPDWQKRRDKISSKDRGGGKN